ncbi:uncharacterized protein [Blastocystis hominis]|uniref:Uncharacterized protein n=1 Tax=Blastocystis hominis TaxID=12968 RepID=D8MAW1_BLAHO|nr:uncharacterized protein [Blastocystis hominis]CBK25200.2 unnamed protein product [Blastocystis hominis]|eukprot:XP_012899248.1 uncharacterized protein [Blastocystis hominis]
MMGANRGRFDEQDMRSHFNNRIQSILDKVDGVHIKVCPPSQGETIEKSTVPFADLLANALSEYESSL